MRDYTTPNQEREGFMEGHDHPWAEKMMCASTTCPVREDCGSHDQGITTFTRFYYRASVEGRACALFAPRS